MIETDNYWLVDNEFILKHHFNLSLDKLYSFNI